MKKIIIVVIALIAVVLLYMVLRPLSKDSTPDTSITTMNNPQKRLGVDDNSKHKQSMRQIDSVTANLNYKFTIKNKIPDSVQNPQLEKSKQVKQ